MNYISINQAANIFKVSERYVRRLCAEGLIPGAAKVGSTWIIPENATISNKPFINIILGCDDNVGLESALYLLERGEKVCYICKSEKQTSNAVTKFRNNPNALIYNVDASIPSELEKIRDDIKKYVISKIIYADNNARFDRVEDITYEMICQNFRGPIYSSVLVTSIFYPLMSNTILIAILHEKASTVGLPNETVFSAAYHGMDGYFDSLYAACVDDDKIKSVIKVYTGSIDSEFWNSKDAENVLKKPLENKIPPKDLAILAIDSANSKNTLVVSEIHIRRQK